MTLTGYTVDAVTPWETASGGRAVACDLPHCAVQTTWTGRDGWYDISVAYFDLLHGHSRFSLSIAGHEVDHWNADDTLPGDTLNGSTSTRRSLDHVGIHHGDSVQVTGWPDGPEKAPLDYLSIVADRVRTDVVANKVH